jgi:transglutaminase-like putative cysteine protease
MDFEELDDTGAPAGWICECMTGPAVCQTDTTNPKHGKRELVLPSGCYAMQLSTTFTTDEGIRFEAFERGGPVMPTDTMLYGFPADPVNDFDELLYVQGFTSSPRDWASVPSHGAMSAANVDQLLLLVANSNGQDDETPGPTIYVDDLKVTQRGPSPPPKVGSLINAQHVWDTGLVASTSPTTIYLSLPSDWASQVPLSFDLDITPRSIVQKVEYAREPEGNWGAQVTFAPTAGVADVRVRWESVALTRQIPEEELPQVFAARTPPAEWLGASAIIESTYPDIFTTAQALTGTSPLDRMLSTIGWTSSNLTYGFAPDSVGLDAVSAYVARMSTCTGYANLAAALGRDVGVPTRHVTNILLGESQDMHSIDEFYLGSELGWRRVEPQATHARVPDDYGFIMREVFPSDESPVANRDSPEGELMLGIPLHEFTETVSNPDAVTYVDNPPRTFTDCAYCPNRSDPQSTLRDATPEAMKRLFARAKRSWARALQEYEAGGLPEREAEARRWAKGAETMGDVERMLDAIE